MAGAKNGAPSTHERRLMESESRWLQKALFALAKAEDDREKLATAREGDDAVKVEIKGKSFDLSTVHSAVTEAVHQRQEHLRETLSQARTALR